MCSLYGAQKNSEMQMGGGASAANPLETMQNRGPGARVNYDFNRNDMLNYQINMGDVANGVRLIDIAKPRPAP